MEGILSKIDWYAVIIHAIFGFMLLKAFGIIDPPDISIWQTSSTLSAILIVLFWGLKSTKNEFKSELNSLKADLHSTKNELKADFHQTLGATEKSIRESVGSVSERLSKL